MTDLLTSIMLLLGELIELFFDTHIHSAWLAQAECPNQCTVRIASVLVP